MHGKNNSRDAVKLPSIYAQDLFNDMRRQVFAAAHVFEESRFLGRIVVTVVGTDDNVILAHIAHQIRQFFVGLAGDPEAVTRNRSCGLLFFRSERTERRST